METKPLSKSEFKSTFGKRMVNITGHEDTAAPKGVIDVIPYVDSVQKDDLGQHVLYDHFVEYVYRSSDNLHDHVLFMTRSKNVYLVIVVDLNKNQIKGHRLLDLNEEYGIAEQTNDLMALHLK